MIKMIKMLQFSIFFGLCIASGQVIALEGATKILAQSGNTSKTSTASAPAKSAKTISESEAKKLALQAVPGKVMDIAIEKKMGADRYVVEVIPEKGGKEVDVIIHMTTGKVLAIEN